MTPFDQHGGTTGDLSACADLRLRAAKRRKARGRTPTASAAERRYLRGVLSIYRKARAPFASATRARSFAAGRDLEAFHLELFMLQVNFKLGSRLDRTLARRLRGIRQSTERSRLKIEEWFAYKRLFNLTPDTVVTLADPRIVTKAFTQ